MTFVLSLLDQLLLRANDSANKWINADTTLLVDGHLFDAEMYPTIAKIMPERAILHLEVFKKAVQQGYFVHYKDYTYRLTKMGVKEAKRLNTFTESFT